MINMWNAFITVGGRLIGDVEEHPKLGKFECRETITTSTIVKKVGDFITTRSGTEYCVQSWAVDPKVGELHLKLSEEL